MVVGGGGLHSVIKQLGREGGWVHGSVPPSLQKRNDPELPPFLPLVEAAMHSLNFITAFWVHNIIVGSTLLVIQEFVSTQLLYKIWQVQPYAIDSWVAMVRLLSYWSLLLGNQAKRCTYRVLHPFRFAWHGPTVGVFTATENTICAGYMCFSSTPVFTVPGWLGFCKL